MSHVRIRHWRVPLPRARWQRLGVGSFFVMGGTLSVLPILGLGMLPVGLLVLSYDLPLVRRWRRRGEVTLLRWWRYRRPCWLIRQR